VKLCHELSLDLVEPKAHGTYVWTRTGLVPLPETSLGVPAEIGAIARWQGLSRGARVRALGDLVKRAPRSETPESIGGLVRRRLGDEVADVLVQPLLGGLFGGDIDRLDVRATFPELATWERGYGSLIHGAAASRRAASSAGPMFVRPSRGVSALPRELLAAVGPERVHTATAATGVRAEGSGSVVRAGEFELSADAIVLATPAFVAAELLGDLAPRAAADLAAIPHATTAVVVLVYPEGTADVLPEVSGFVVPAGRAPMTSATFVSRTWPAAEFGSRSVVRCAMGGVGAEDVVDAPDEEIVDAVGRHLAAVLALPEVPEAAAVVRWPRAMPQYEMGHLERVTRIWSSLPPGIFVAGNAYRGVGVADAVRSANQAADLVLAHLRGEDGPTEGEHLR
jgi:protoporphyrinogen/coproporphyrinogen III oxidase